MEDFNILEDALNKATLRGVFNLQETNVIINALVRTKQNLERHFANQAMHKQPVKLEVVKDNKSEDETPDTVKSD